jgi:chromosome segregation ATPase
MADDTESNIKKLEDEKKALEEKNKGLAKVIELTSQQNAEQKQASAKAAQTTKQAKIAVDTGTQKALDELRSSMKTIKKSLKESLQGPAEKHEQMKKMVADIEAKIKDVDKITAIETKITDMEKKVAEQVQKAPSSLGNLFGGFGAGKADAGAPKNAPRNIRELMKHIDGIKDTFETRLLNMERRVDSIRHKLGKKNLERLEELISSKQDISENVVPRKVREEVEKILSTFSFEVEDMADSAKELADNVEKSNESFDHSVENIRSIQKRMDAAERMISEMRTGYQQTSKTVDKLVEEVEKVDISDKEVEDVIKEADKLSEKVEDVEKSLSTIEADYRMPESRPRRRRPAARKPAKKRAKPKKKAAHSHKKPAKKRKAAAPAKRPAVDIGQSRTERINSTLKRVEMAYENGLITKERYDRIAGKLKRLKKMG